MRVKTRKWLSKCWMAGLSWNTAATVHIYRKVWWLFFLSKKFNCSKRNVNTILHNVLNSVMKLQACDQHFFPSCLRILMLTEVSCTEPAVYLRPSGHCSLPPTVTPRALWSCANLPFAKLPSILPEAHHHCLPLSHGVMHTNKPMTGVLLLEWRDNLEAQWSTGPLETSQVRDATGPPTSHNQDTHTHKHKHIHTENLENVK